MKEKLQHVSEYFNATEMLKEYNMKNSCRKVIPEFLQNKGIRVLLNNSFTNGLVPIIAKRGKNGSTLMHKNIKPYFYNWLNKLPNISYTRDETVFVNGLIDLLNDVCEVIPQKQFDIYFVDAYIPKLNLVIEFDEDHHNKSKNKKYDKDRERYIKEKFGVNFIRHKEKDNHLCTYNKIVKFLLKESK